MLSFKDLFLKITEDFKTVTQKFIAANIPTDDVTTYITKFKTLSTNQRLTGLEKNIDTWGNKSFDEFKKFIDDIESKVTNRGQKKGQKKDSGTIVDITTPKQKAAGWNIIIPTNKEASCYHGTGANWCVSTYSQNNQFNKYFIDDSITLIFCLNDKKENWAIACSLSGSFYPEFFDMDNTSITKTKFNRDTKLKADEIMKLALGHEQVKVVRTTQQNNSMSYVIQHTKTADPELEKKVIDSKNSKYAYLYASHVLKGPFKAGEEVISKDANYAYNYAYHFLNGPFKAGEEAIAKDGNYAYLYAQTVLKGPFKAGEAAIVNNDTERDDYGHSRAYYYAKNVLKDPDPNTWVARYKNSHK